MVCRIQRLRSHFLQYSAALPYTKKQIVSAKYLIGLLAQLALLVVIGTVQGVRMSRSGAFVSGDFVSLMLLMLALSMLTSSISLPFVFKWGVEKGRIAYYVMIGFVCGAGVLFSQMFKEPIQNDLPSGLVFAGVTVSGIAVYAISWYLSAVFYKQREL